MGRMTLQEHKQLGTGWFAAPQRYVDLCCGYKGSAEAPAAVLRAYVYSARTKEDVLCLSDRDIYRIINGQWSERTIASSRVFLYAAGLLVPESVRSGQKSRVTVNFEVLENEKALQNSVAAKDEEALQFCKAKSESVAILQSPSLVKELAKEEVASSFAPRIAELRIESGRSNKPALAPNPNTIKLLTGEVERHPLEDQEAAFENIAATAAAGAYSFGLVVARAREFTPGVPAKRPGASQRRKPMAPRYTDQSSPPECWTGDAGKAGSGIEADLSSDMTNEEIRARMLRQLAELDRRPMQSQVGVCGAKEARL